MINCLIVNLRATMASYHQCVLPTATIVVGLIPLLEDIAIQI